MDTLNNIFEAASLLLIELAEIYIEKSNRVQNKHEKKIFLERVKHCETIAKDLLNFINEYKRNKKNE